MLLYSIIILNFVDAMLKQLSILIPVYNDSAVGLAQVLQRQAEAISGLEYEIMIVDDGSTDSSTIAENTSIERLRNCRFVRGKRHDCRSAMRNALQKHARYPWRLMVDARLSILGDDFLERYLQSARDGEPCVVCGGVEVRGSDEMMRENLRFRYEKHEERNHSAGVRQRRPYLSFRATNMMYHGSVLERVPYCERIKGYGYEDVMLGKNMQEAKMSVRHISNPVAYTSFEGNASYLGKVEEALLTLRTFDTELALYSPLLCAERRLRGFGMLPLVRLFHRLFSTLERRNLTGSRPSLLVFKLYKLGYLVSLPAAEKA